MLILNPNDMQEMNSEEMNNIQGGSGDRPFGTSYEGCPPAEKKENISEMDIWSIIFASFLL